MRHAKIKGVEQAKKERPGRAKKGNGADFPFPLPLQGPYGLKQELNYNTATLASNKLYKGTLTQIFIFFKYGKSWLPEWRPPAAQFRLPTITAAITLFIKAPARKGVMPSETAFPGDKPVKAAR